MIFLKYIGQRLFLRIRIFEKIVIVFNPCLSGFFGPTAVRILPACGGR